MTFPSPVAHRTFVLWTRAEVESALTGLCVRKVAALREAKVMNLMIRKALAVVDGSDIRLCLQCRGCNSLTCKSEAKMQCRHDVGGGGRVTASVE